MLDETTQMILINVLAFEKMWQEPMLAGCDLTTFYSTPDSSKEVRILDFLWKSFFGLIPNSTIKFRARDLTHLLTTSILVTIFYGPTLSLIWPANLQPGPYIFVLFYILEKE